MALATRCPHCNTTFRVASDQLKLRGGIVRCGSCHEIFDGNKSLFDPDAVPVLTEPAPEPVPEPVLALVPVPVPEPEAVPEPEPVPEPAATRTGDFKYEPDPNFDAEPAPLPFNGYVDFPLDLIDEIVEAAPPPEEPAPEPEAAPKAEDANSPWDDASWAEESRLQETSETPHAETPEPNSHYYEEDGYYDDPPDYYDDPPDYYDDPPEAATAADADAEAPPQPPVDDLFNSVLPDLAHGGPLPLLRQAAHAEPEPVATIPTPRPPKSKKKKPNVRGPATVMGPITGQAPPPEHDEPAFVRRSRELEESGRTRRLAMIGGSAILAIALLTQGVTTFRNVLVASMPSLKAPIGAVCAVFGCRIELPAEIDALTVETGELQTLGGNNFSLTTLLRNQSSLIQTWPHIELALTDSNDKVLLRRVIAPADYLTRDILVSKGFGAHSEQPVKLLFEVSQIKASGYRIAIFYP